MDQPFRILVIESSEQNIAAAYKCFHDLREKVNLTVINQVDMLMETYRSFKMHDCVLTNLHFSRSFYGPPVSGERLVRIEHLPHGYPAGGAFAAAAINRSKNTKVIVVSDDSSDAPWMKLMGNFMNWDSPATRRIAFAYVDRSLNRYYGRWDAAKNAIVRCAADELPHDDPPIVDWRKVILNSRLFAPYDVGWLRDVIQQEELTPVSTH